MSVVLPIDDTETLKISFTAMIFFKRETQNLPVRSDKNTWHGMC
jgi:hypothetical protein